MAWLPIRLACLACLATIALCLAGVPTQAAQRAALVIGNAAYVRATPLKNPANDAKAVAESLKRLGFDVHLAVDASQKDMLAALDSFSKALPGAEAALFYYSGHGIQIDAQNFLLPVDIEVTTERTFRYGAVDINEVLTDMEAHAAVNIVILDACRDNPFAEELKKLGGLTRSAGLSRGLARMQPSTKGTIIAYSAAAGEVADDGAADHSPYTEALLAFMEQPGVEVGLLFRRVAGRVIEKTQEKQRPEILLRLVDEFYLKPAETQVAIIAAEQQIALPTAKGDLQPADQAQTIAVEPEVPSETGQPKTVQPSTSWAKARDRWKLPPIPDWATNVTLPSAPTWAPQPLESRAESEPNGSTGKSNWIALDAEVALSIGEKGDNDWLAFEIGHPGLLKVTAPGTPPEIDLVVRLWDADRQAVADWQGAPRPGGAIDVSIPVGRPGLYWLEIADSYNDGASPTLFPLTLQFTPQADRYEPNNTFGQARALPLGVEFQDNILPLADADWFKLWIPAQGLLDVSAAQVPPELDIAFRLWTLDGEVIRDWMVPPRPGADTLASIEIKKPGTYLIETADSYNDRWSIAPFLMATRFTPADDELEPNDLFADATPVPATGSHRIAIFPRGDNDWLRFDVDHPGELAITARDVPQKLDVAFRVWNEDKAAISGWFAPPRPGADTVGVVDLPAAGSYAIEIADSYNDASDIESLTLETRFIPQPDQYEPNNTISTATPVTPGGEVLFNILPKGDVDWFKLEVPTGGELKAAIDEGPPDLDVNFRVWNANREAITGWFPPPRPGGLTEGTVDLPSGGTYHLEVRDGYDDARSIQPLTLRTQFTPADDTYEPNNTIGAARPLALGAAVMATILPKGDNDWYLIELPGTGELKVVIDEVDPALDVAVRLWDADGQAGQWFGPPRPGGVTEAVIAIAGPGPYRLEVADSYNDARAAKPYRILANFAGK